jgi:hypothetical protein
MPGLTFSNELIIGLKFDRSVDVRQGFVIV